MAATGADVVCVARAADQHHGRQQEDRPASGQAALSDDAPEAKRGSEGQSS